MRPTLTVRFESSAVVVRSTRMARDGCRHVPKLGATASAVHGPVGSGTSCVDEDKILAQYSHGILEITLPKVAKVLEPPKAKEIPVKPVSVLKENKAA